MSKLKLNLAHEAGEILTKEEMKNVVGGTTGSGSFVDPCKTGQVCYVVYLNEEKTVSARVSGTCQMAMVSNAVTCYCNAMSPGSSLMNVSGMSHCWK